MTEQIRLVWAEAWESLEMAIYSAATRGQTQSAPTAMGTEWAVPTRVVAMAESFGGRSRRAPGEVEQREQELRRELAIDPVLCLQCPRHGVVEDLLAAEQTSD